MAKEEKELAIIERSDTEHLKISISEFNGKSYLNMRIFLRLMVEKLGYLQRRVLLLLLTKLKLSEMQLMKL